MTNAFITLVKSKAGITNLIGSSPARIYPVVLKQNTAYPAIAFSVISLIPHNTFDGGSTYDFYMIDLQFYDQDYDDVKTLFDTFRTQIEDSTGTYSSIEIDHVWYMGSGGEDYIDDLHVYTKHMELKIAVQR